MRITIEKPKVIPNGATIWQGLLVMDLPTNDYTASNGELIIVNISL